VSAGAAGGLSGIHRFVVTTSVNNASITLQAQNANSMGGGGTSKAGALFLIAGNTTNHSPDPGPKGLAGAGRLTFQHGGILTLNDASNITTAAGQLVLRSGSISNVTVAAAIGGVPTGPNAPTIEAGNVVRIGVSNPTFLNAVSNANSAFVVTNNVTINTAT